MALHNYIYYKQPDPLINTIARPHDARPQVLQYPKQEKQGESEKKPTEKKKTRMFLSTDTSLSDIVPDRFL